MNDDQFPNEDQPKPKRTRKPQIAAAPVYDDPYADDVEWNSNVAIDAAPLTPISNLDPYAEPAIEELIAQPNEQTPPFYAADPFTPEQLPAQTAAATPLFQPDIVPNFVPEPFTPESTDETVRRSGLAYSIGIVFVVSVAFMLLLGWIADWMFGTKPWGLVGGIVFGSIIGFVQVVRISSRIFTPNKNGPAISPLMSHVADDEEIEQGHQSDQGEPRDTL